MKNYEQHLTNEIEKLKEEIKKLKNKDNDVIKNTLWSNCHNYYKYELRGSTYVHSFLTDCMHL